MCMVSCGNPEALQKHFDAVHSNDGPASFTPPSNANTTSVYNSPASRCMNRMFQVCNQSWIFRLSPIFYAHCEQGLPTFTELFSNVDDTFIAHMIAN